MFAFKSFSQFLLFGITAFAITGCSVGFNQGRNTKSLNPGDESTQDSGGENGAGENSGGEEGNGSGNGGGNNGGGEGDNNDGDHDNSDDNSGGPLSNGAGENGGGENGGGEEGNGSGFDDPCLFDCLSFEQLGFLDETLPEAVEDVVANDNRVMFRTITTSTADARVFLYERDSSANWSEVGEFLPTPNGGAQNFGFAITAHESFYAVSTRGQGGSGPGSQPRVDFYQVSQLSGIAHHSSIVESASGINVSNPSWWGYSVAISGDFVAVGSPRESDGSGRVYVYKRNGNVWEQKTVVSSSAVNPLWFGGRVTLDWSPTLNKHLLVVANIDHYAIDGIEENHPIEIFEINESGNAFDVQPHSQFYPEANLNTGAQFGFSLKHDGDWILTSATRNNDVGTAFFYNLATAAQQSISPQNITPATEGFSAQFGLGMDLKDGAAFIGAPFSKTFVGIDQVYWGDIHAFFLSEATGLWTSNGKLNPNFGQPSDSLHYFGARIAIGSDEALVGLSKSIDAGTSNPKNVIRYSWSLEQ